MLLLGTPFTPRVWPFWGLNPKTSVFAKAPPLPTSVGLESLSPHHYAIAETCSALSSQLLSSAGSPGVLTGCSPWESASILTSSFLIHHFSSPSLSLQFPATLAALNSVLISARLLLSAITILPTLRPHQ